MRIQRETLETMWAEAGPLTQRHWAEIATYPDIALEPHRETYEAAETGGILRVYTAREDDGRLVGYSLFFVSPGLHYRGSLQAIEDIMFVDPSARGKMLGVRLIEFGDEQLRAEGVQVVFRHAKVAHPTLAKLLEKSGYAPDDVRLSKRLDR